MKDYSAKIEAAFNSFDGKNLDSLDNFYAKDVAFEDPVTKVKGLAKLKKYYAHAYKNVESIRFEFGDIFHQGEFYAAPWKMHLKAKGLNGGKMFVVAGLSHFKFNAQGLVTYHHDYLDLGDMVYERLPVVGLAVRQIKKFLTPSL